MASIRKPQIRTICYRLFLQFSQYHLRLPIWSNIWQFRKTSNGSARDEVGANPSMDDGNGDGEKTIPWRNVPHCWAVCRRYYFIFYFLKLPGFGIDTGRLAFMKVRKKLKEWEIEWYAFGGRCWLHHRRRNKWMWDATEVAGVSQRMWCWSPYHKGTAFLWDMIFCK